MKIWTTKGQPLKEKDWLANGYLSLRDYVEKLKAESDKGMAKQSAQVRNKTASFPLVSFGKIDADGTKEVVYLAETIDNLPTESIEGVLIFNEVE